MLAMISNFVEVQDGQARELCRGGDDEIGIDAGSGRVLGQPAPGRDTRIDYW